MTECFSPEVRDYLPDLVHGRLGDVDAATLAAHVEACEACTAEVALLKEARRTAPPAPAVSIDSILALLPVVTVPPHVTHAPSRSDVSRGRSVIWKVLAAVAVVITGGMLANSVNMQPEVAVTSPHVPAIVPLAQATPETPTVAGASLSLVAGVQDLTDAQIKTLLAELDDVEAIPSLEPDQAVIPVVDTEPIP